MTNARHPEGMSDALEQRRFYTDNPRELRLLAYLVARQGAYREVLDRSVGASNSPDIVFRLRQRGYAIPCDRVERIDRDGRPCKVGWYRLTADDKRAARAVLMRKQSGHIEPPELVALLALAAVAGWLLAAGGAR